MKGQLQKAFVHPDPRSHRPGAVAEYWSGTNFDIPCVRRIVPAVSFQGKESWPDMPPEFITARWSGFIDAPESGPYTFQAIGTDGARLFVDDVKLF